MPQDCEIARFVTGDEMTLALTLDFPGINDYARMYEGDNTVCLDGNFTIEELEKILIVMKAAKTVNIPLDDPS